MTDKVQLIKEEIERLKHTDIAYDRSRFMLLLQIEDFINSLPEEHNEDLEEEFNRFLDEEEGVPRMWHSDEQMEWGKDIARHFAEWQKQQMMKDAVYGEIVATSDNGWESIRIQKKEHCCGDKVKIIILKTE